jgi:quercetin dioxygenase-like cupin family protein
MKTKAILLGTGLSLATLAADKTAPGVIHVDHETVAAAFVSGSPLVVTNNFRVQTGRRTAPGEVEIHDRDTDIFYVLEGSAVFVTGGKAIEPRNTGPGETRAKAITGGDERKLSKGDVIVIGKGIPHWFKEVNGLLLYYVVKVSDA